MRVDVFSQSFLQNDNQRDEAYCAMSATILLICSDTDAVENYRKNFYQSL
jgi:hypothetical protein